MLKKTMFCLFGAALFLVSGNALFAQKDLGFTGALPGTVVPLEEGTKIELRDAAELTPEELQAALEKSSCSVDKGGAKLPTHCFACTGLNCTGTCYPIPCGFYINAKDQVPPPPGFKSFITGCKTTYVSSCNDLSTAAGCVAGAFPVGPPSPPNFPDNFCINYQAGNPAAFLQSVGCV